MATRKNIEETHGLFYVTFTCYQWLSLFQITNSYDLVYDWFDVLISKGHQIAGYVIMPNHVHCLIGLNNSNQSINTHVGNGKRFMAYELIKRLHDGHHDDILHFLTKRLTEKELSKGQNHRAFESSSDIKLCDSIWFIEQKLDYMHRNPCSKKWNLVQNPIDYRHSSMRFYYDYGRPGLISKLTPYTALFEDK